MYHALDVRNNYSQVNAACNDLEALPRDIVKLNALTILDVSDNIIGTLPETVCKMTSLQQLNVADNRIMEFPKVRVNIEFH